MSGFFNFVKNAVNKAKEAALMPILKIINPQIAQLIEDEVNKVEDAQLAEQQPEQQTEQQAEQPAEQQAFEVKDPVAFLENIDKDAAKALIEEPVKVIEELNTTVEEQLKNLKLVRDMNEFMLGDEKQQEHVDKIIDNAMKKLPKEREKLVDLVERIHEIEATEPVAGPIDGHAHDRLNKKYRFRGEENEWGTHINIPYPNSTRRRYFLNKPADDMLALYNNIKTIYDSLIAEGRPVVAVHVWFTGIFHWATRKVHVDPNLMDSYQSFSNWIEKVANGEVPGSDPIPESEWRLEHDVFDVIYMNPAIGFGKASPTCFNIIGFDSNHCAVDCLNYIFKKRRKSQVMTVAEHNRLELFKLDNLTKYIEDNDLRINIAYDVFNLDPKKYVSIRQTSIKTTINDRTVYLSPFSYDDITLTYHLKYDGLDTPTIIYSYSKQHFDVLAEEPLKDVYVCRSFNYYVKTNNEYKKITSLAQLNKEYKIVRDAPQEKLPISYIFLDYETVTDWMTESVSRPYSLSILRATEFELDSLSSYDENNKRDMIDKFIKSNSVTWVGLDCTSKFNDYLLEHGTNQKFYIVTFNGANFDHFLLYDGLKRLDPDSVTNPFYNGTRLLDFKIYGRHSLFDVRKHVVGSLASNCQAFKVKTVVKQQFDHKQAQEIYDNFGHNEEEFVKNLPVNLIHYNTYDVLSLAVVFHRYKSAVRAIPSMEDFADRLCEYRTIGGLIKARLKTDWCSDGIAPPILHVKKGEMPNKKERKKANSKLMKIYDDMLASKSGGRVQLFSGVLKAACPMMSLDVCSLYPYVMCINDVYYPGGEIAFGEYKNHPADLIGFYYCDIDQTILRQKGLPLIIPMKEDGGNNWITNDVVKDYLISTVKIDQLIKYGLVLGKSLIVKDGIYFTKKHKSCEMFRTIFPFMKEKNRQDELKRNNSPEYNQSIREVCKLGPNSISGKMIEGLHLETIVEMTADQFKSCKDGAYLLGIVNNKFIVSTKKSKEECMSKSSPIYLGILIYDYAQRYMYEHVYSHFTHEQRVYTDTDSFKCKTTDAHSWINGHAANTIVPHWPEVEEHDPRYKSHPLYDPNSKVFGSFEDEYAGMSQNQLHYFLDKKMYLSSFLGDKAIHKSRIKGVSGRDVLIKINPDNSYDVKKVDGTIVTCNRDTTQQELYHLSASSTKLEDNWPELFELLYTNKQAAVLSQCFVRSVRPTTRITPDGNYDKSNPHVNSVKIFTRVKQIKLKEIREQEKFNKQIKREELLKRSNRLAN